MRLACVIPAAVGMLSSALLAGAGFVLLGSQHIVAAGALLFGAWTMFTAVTIAVSLTLRTPSRRRSRA